jgi:hypothetical protein
MQWGRRQISSRSFSAAAPIRRCHSASTAIEHGELGAIEIFLVPIGPDEVDQRYQAIFT